MGSYDNLNVLIPMAGYGERFKLAGYTTYKPFIEVNGKPMIDLVIDAFPEQIKKHIIVNPQLIDRDQRLYLESRPNVNLINIAPHKNGPAYSMLEAAGSLPLSQ